MYSLGKIKRKNYYRIISIFAPTLIIRSLVTGLVKMIKKLIQFLFSFNIRDVFSQRNRNRISYVKKKSRLVLDVIIKVSTNSSTYHDMCRINRLLVSLLLHTEYTWPIYDKSCDNSFLVRSLGVNQCIFDELTTLFRSKVISLLGNL